VRGEDYCFNFTGKLRDGKLHFRLHMQVRGGRGQCSSSRSFFSRWWASRPVQHLTIMGGVEKQVMARPTAPDCAT